MFNQGSNMKPKNRLQGKPMYLSIRIVGTRFVWIAAACAVMLTACGKKEPPTVERIRAIKTHTVEASRAGLIRKFSGVVEAADKSSISFEVSGNVQEVRVNVGDRVSKGQVLAVLDTRTYKLNVEAAEANLGKANVQLVDKRSDLDRFQRIARQDPGAISQTAIEQAEAAYDSAVKNVEFATSQLNLAKRDLAKTVLRAPFDGVIADRFVDAFNEVARGQKLFDIYIEGGMEVAISIPESEIKGIYAGLDSVIRFPTIPGSEFRGDVTEISSVASVANAFPVKVTISEPDKQIRPGMTAEVTLALEGEGVAGAYSIPIISVVPGDDPRETTGGYVFVYDSVTSTVYDSVTSTVKKTRVFGRVGIRKNNFVATSGIKAGDIIAIAGVSFLENGQKVKLMREQQ
jgi:RND family efflux transporter MFP subunit